MRLPAGAVLASLGVLFLVACGEETTRPEPNGPSLALSATGPLECDINGLKQAARAYFASNRDPIFTIISELQTATKFGPTSAGTQKAFDGLARLAEVRFTSAQKNGSTGADGNLVARGFIGCMEPAVFAGLPADVSFTAALDAGGLFEVRGDDTVDPPTLGVYSKGGTEIWAAQPQSTSTWGQSAGVRHLIHGFATTLASNDEQVSAQAFEFSTVPAGVTYDPELLRGVCDIVGATYRIQRHNALLPFAPITCPTTTSLRELQNTPPVMVALAERVVDFFMPTRVEATMLGAGMAGLGSEFSPHVLVDLKAVTMTFISQPLDGFVDQTIPGSGTSGYVEVQVTSLAGTALPGVVVTLVVAGNQGSTVVLSGNTAVTDDAGIATFPTLSVNKAGGYTLYADGAYDGIPGDTGTSDLFNIKNK
jgi:hypothetical protein